MLNKIITPRNNSNSNSNNVVKFNKFLEKIIKYKTTMPDAYEKFVGLYELLFQIMDIAMIMNGTVYFKKHYSIYIS